MTDYTIHINPKVKRVIQSFQSAAVRTLSGPNGIPIRSGSFLGCQSKMNATEAEECNKAVSCGKKASEENIVKYENPFLSSPPFPRQKMPLFGPVDSTRSERTDTILEGETIACFTVGGEKRLCLPQILNTVLRDFTLQQINCVCEDLNIFCSRCNKVQLEVLKMMRILPSSAPSCGLITKTDAERLCTSLLHGNPERSLDPPSRNSFKVYHECFGKCKGIFNSDFYTSPDSKCIRCVDCYGMFAPSKFVCHSHKSLENRTCHWGFDSENWRYYLLLSKDQNLEASMKLHDAIDEIKSRFDPSHKQKRRQSPELSARTEPSNSKRIKSDSNTDSTSDPVISSPAQISKWDALSLRQLSAFYPWSPYLLSAIKEGKLLPPPAIMGDQLAGILPSNLHTGPPVLLDPERVIPYSESERYGRHFTPNISLAPSSSSQRSSPDENEQEVKSKPVLSQAATNRSHLSEMSNHKAVNGSCKGDAGRKESVEYDVQTDTDDSSLASPTDSCKDVNISAVPAYKSTLQQEMNMIRSLLNGKMSPSPEAHSHFLQEFSRLRAKTEETVQWLLRVHRVLKQELGSSQRQKVELYKLLSKAERDMKGLAVEKEYALKEARLQKQQTQSRSLSKFDQELECRRRNIESVYRKVCKENHNLQRELSVMAESSSSVKFSEDAHRSFQSRLKMVLDLTVSHDLTADTGKRKQSLDIDSRSERSITVD